jgi:GT2 family glycosyltransferase
MSAARVSVIIVNWHSEDLLALVLAALDQQSVAPEHVVVVNNGSTKALPVDRYSRGRVLVLCTGKNEGFAAGNNLAIRQAVDSEWVALLNPDAIPEHDWLERLLEATRRHPEARAFGSVQLDGGDPSIIDGLGDVYHVSGAAWRQGHGSPTSPTPVEAREIFAPCAAAALYRRAALLEAGGFDEDFFCYLEDVDLGFRLRLLGHNAMLVPGAIVHHQGSATSGGPKSDFAIYHGQRNLVWAYFKNMPRTLLWRYLPQHLLLNLAALLFFTCRGQGVPVIRAKWHALKALPRMIAKRHVIQAGARAPADRIRAAMATGWLAPYRHKAR